MEHNLKIRPEYFEAVKNGQKMFELRRDDRGFSVNDTLLLREWSESGYSGRTLRCHVNYILRNYDGLDPHYVIMSISLCH